MILTYRSFILPDMNLIKTNRFSLILFVCRVHCHLSFIKNMFCFEKREVQFSKGFIAVLMLIALGCSFKEFSEPFPEFTLSLMFRRVVRIKRQHVIIKIFKLK